MNTRPKFILMSAASLKASDDKWVNLDSFYTICGENKCDSKKTVFIFPGNVTDHHTPSTTLFSLKGGSGLAVPAEAIGKAGCPVLSLPTTEMLGHYHQKTIAKNAIADLWRAIGAGFNLVLPVTPAGPRAVDVNGKTKKMTYFRSAINDNGTMVEPLFWGNVEVTPNLDLADQYVAAIKQIQQFMAATLEEQAKIIASFQGSEDDFIYKAYTEGQKERAQTNPSPWFDPQPSKQVAYNRAASSSSAISSSLSNSPNHQGSKPTFLPQSSLQESKDGDLTVALGKAPTLDPSPLIPQGAPKRLDEVNAFFEKYSGDKKEKYMGYYETSCKKANNGVEITFKPGATSAALPPDYPKQATLTLVEENGSTKIVPDAVNPLTVRAVLDSAIQGKFETLNLNSIKDDRTRAGFHQQLQALLKLPEYSDKAKDIKINYTSQLAATASSTSLGKQAAKPQDRRAWATGKEIRDILNKEFKESAYIMDPETFSVNSLFDSATAGEAAIEIAKTIAGYTDAEGNKKSGWVKEGKLEKPIVIVMNLDRVRVAHSRDVNAIGGSHWVSLVIRPAGEKVEISLTDSMNHARPVPPILLAMLTEGWEAAITAPKSGKDNTPMERIHAIPAAFQKDQIQVKSLLTQNQQSDSWSCGLWACDNAIQAAKGQPLNENMDVKVLTEKYRGKEREPEPEARPRPSL